MFCLRERPIISGFLECLGLLIPLCLLIRAKLSKVWGFPLLARVPRGLTVSLCFAGLLINTLLITDKKPKGFSFLFAARFMILNRGYFKLYTKPLVIHTIHTMHQYCNFVHCSRALLYYYAPITCMHHLIL